MTIFYQIVGVFFSVWWLWLPVLLVVLFFDLWIRYLKNLAIKKINWMMLEIKVPRDVQRTPKSMEQIFTGLHGALTKVKFLDKYWAGKVQEWFSFEMAGIDGTVYFFIRTPEKFRNLVEAQVHSQYPDAEILEVLDYAGPLANKVPSKAYEIAGTELIFDKADYYPIRTYPIFEEKEEERRVDTMAAFLEILSKLRPGENIFIQYILAPKTDKKWLEEGKEKIDKMMGKKIEKKKGFFAEIWGELEQFVQNLTRAVAVFPAASRATAVRI